MSLGFFWITSENKRLMFVAKVRYLIVTLITVSADCGARCNTVFNKTFDLFAATGA